MIQLVGTNDQQAMLPANFPSDEFQRLSYANGLWLLGGRKGLYTSPSGIDSWSRPASSWAEIGPAAYSANDSRWVLPYGDNQIIHSSNGTSWTVANASSVQAITNRVSDHLYSVAWDRFFYCDGFTLLTSTDGLTYSSTTVNAKCIGMDSAGTTILATDGDSVWKRSTNGTTWSNISGPSSVLSITHSATLGMFIASGEGGSIYTSTNSGTTWSSRASGTSEKLFRVKADDAIGRIVAMSQFPQKSRWSSNGTTWSAVSYEGSLGVARSTWQDSSVIPWSLDSDGTKFMINAGVWGARLYYSTNGQTWIDVR